MGTGAVTLSSRTGKRKRMVARTGEREARGMERPRSGSATQ